MDVKKNDAKTAGASNDPNIRVYSQTIAVIGGGAAGMMAAYFAKLGDLKSRVVLIEKNKYLGAKVLISGGGRCNVTTGILDVREVLKNYPRGAEFLRTAMQNFPPESVMSWFETHGTLLKIEEDLRVFPASNKGDDVMAALMYALNNLSVEIRLNHHMIALENSIGTVATTGEDKFLLKFKDGGHIEADKVIITTGGNAYRHTGSTGDGYEFAKAMGHNITPLAPSLSSFYTAEKWPHEISGLSFKKAHLTFLSSQQSNTGQGNFERTGPFLFTHKGVSGPAIFALSGMAAFEPFSAEKPARLIIDFFPDQTDEELGKVLDERILANPNKKISNLLATFFPHSLADKITIEILSEEFSKTTATHLTKKMRQEIVAVMKGIELHLVGRGAGDEFVTAGGVPLDEVNPRTMESNLRRGLYFAGELLDIDGYTGGFNLQASWATGTLAGESASAN